MQTRSQYHLNGFKLEHETVLEGTNLDPKWALVRARRSLDMRDGDVSGNPADGDLEFGVSMARISVTGAFLPYRVAGDVRAVEVPGGVSVTASASIGSTLLGFVISLVALKVGFKLDLGSTGYWVLAGVIGAVAVLHVWQTAKALQRITRAATTL